ncbi:hypothetical protein CVU37_12180 [candidate division BRC1 bacterium HGW-BRC1-1]|jgi:hypothetical protein|nr:MAG: hypothetical protein CVU37_12180 [candidate division BRC1 bacterium HGW-BRC1-1]
MKTDCYPRTELIAFCCLAIIVFLLFSFLALLVEASSSDWSYLDIIGSIYALCCLGVLAVVPRLYRERAALQRVLGIYRRAWMLMLLSAAVASAVLWWRYDVQLWALFDREAPANLIRPYPFRGIAHALWTFGSVWLIVSCAGMAYKLGLPRKPVDSSAKNLP